ncbi:MerR family transcriptional regulator [Nocardia jiangsuensis]|uniref:MerR family transcriptional regulator n=1 Tax=Nocardia jiangsuensis TaxID=1691563 RepID=A0ABV8DM53_9NOCA
MPETIGEVAARFGLTPHVLRHWEDVGLLRPRRDQVGRRRYGPADAETVAMILLGKQAGLALDDLAAVFAAAADRDERRRLLAGHRDRLAARIARDTAALAVVEHALGCASPDVRSCPEFQAKVAAATADGGAVRSVQDRTGFGGVH